MKTCVLYKWPPNKFYMDAINFIVQEMKKKIKNTKISYGFNCVWPFGLVIFLFPLFKYLDPFFMYLYPNIECPQFEFLQWVI